MKKKLLFISFLLIMIIGAICIFNGNEKTKNYTKLDENLLAATSILTIRGENIVFSDTKSPTYYNDSVDGTNIYNIEFTVNDGYVLKNMGSTVNMAVLTIVKDKNKDNTYSASITNFTKTTTFDIKAVIKPEVTVNIMHGKIDGSESKKFTFDEVQNPSGKITADSGYLNNEYDDITCDPDASATISLSSDGSLSVSNATGIVNCTVTLKKITSQYQVKLTVKNGTWANGKTEITEQANEGSYTTTSTIQPKDGFQLTGATIACNGTNKPSNTQVDAGGHVILSTVSSDLSCNITLKEGNEDKVSCSTVNFRIVSGTGTFSNNSTVDSHTIADINKQYTIKTTKCSAITASPSLGITDASCDNDGTGHFKFNENLFKTEQFLSDGDCTVNISIEQNGSGTSGTTTPGGGSTATIPTTTAEVCPINSDSVKMKPESAGVEYGVFGNHKYLSEEGIYYYCVNPGGGMPTSGCKVELSVADALKESPNERGRVAILISSASMDNKADALNAYTCSSEINMNCSAGERSATLRAYGDTIYTAVQAYLSDTQSIYDDNTGLDDNDGSRTVRFSINEGNDAIIGTLGATSVTKYAAYDQDSVTTSQVWTNNKVRMVTGLSNNVCYCDGKECSNVKLELSGSNNQLKVSGLSKLADTVSVVSCTTSVTTDSVAKNISVNVSGGNDTIKGLLIEAFLARNDDNWIVIEDPYTVDFVSSKPTGTGDMDLEATVKINTESEAYPIDKITKVEFYNGTTIVTSAKNSDGTYKLTIKNGNNTSNGLCTPLRITAKIYYGDTVAMIMYLVTNSQKLYTNPGTAEAITSPYVDIARPNCVSSCFSGSNSLKNQHSQGLISDSEYANACCSQSDASGQMGSEFYKTYCEPCGNNVVAPVCQTDGSDGYIIEADTTGINKTNYNKCIKNKTDINGESYKVQGNDYCGIYCKEDAEYKFQGFGYDPNGDDYAITAGRFFVFKNALGEGDLPWFHQSRSCVVDLDYSLFLKNLYEKTYELGDEIASIKQESIRKQAGYYGTAYKAIIDFVSADKEYDKASSEVESIKASNPDYKTGCRAAESRENSQQQALDNCNNRCSSAINKKTCRSNCSTNNPVYDADDTTDCKDEKRIEELENKMATELANRNNALKLYESNRDNIVKAIKQYKTCINFVNMYTSEDLPTLINFYYSDMDNPGLDIADVIDDLNLTPKTKVFTPLDGTTGVVDMKDGRWSVTSGSERTLFDFVDTMTLDPTKVDQSTVATDYASGFEHETDDKFKFYRYGLSEVEATVSYGIGVEMFAVIPSGKIITSKDKLFGTVDVQTMGYGLPVSISTQARQYIYRFQIGNFGKNGRLSKALNRAMSSEEYICTYSVKNEVTCPTNETCNECYNNVSKDGCSSNIPRVEIEEGELTANTRTVSLGNLNPNERDTFKTSNWGTATGVAVRTAIETKGEEIYNEEPMYSFVLDRSTIKAIREYNTKTDYSDFALDCDDDNGRHCVSAFVTKYSENELDNTRSNWNEYSKSQKKIVGKVEDNMDYGEGEK